MGQNNLTPDQVNSKKDFFNKGIRWNLNEDGSHFIRVTLTNQLWIRFNQNNPGSVNISNSTTMNLPANQFDISLRRTRIQFFGQVTDRIFFYSQVGMNNFNYLSARKPSIFFHDVTGEYAVIKKHLTIGGGLTGWASSSRFAAPAVVSIMGLDAPIFEQSTNDATDQFLRKFAVFSKGQISKLEYRIAVAKPFAIQQSFLYNPAKPISNESLFSTNDPYLQYSGYFVWQFFDQEAHQIPYMPGTYLGHKKVFNIGIGFAYQPKAMWRVNTMADTLYSDLKHLNIDLFLDLPIGKTKKVALSAYAGFFHTNFGYNYLRNLGVNNLATGVAPNSNSLSGGNSFPMIGTGNTIFSQFGILTPPVGKTELKFMPYASIQASFFQKLNQPSIIYEGGINFYLKEHHSKLTLGIQNRPIFDNQSLKSIQRLNMIVLQYQIAI